MRAKTGFRDIEGGVRYFQGSCGDPVRQQETVPDMISLIDGGFRPRPRTSIMADPDGEIRGGHRTSFARPSTPDEPMSRCFGDHNELYAEYHDREWGVPVHDDPALFELLILEGAQAGLSWETVLKKREHYRDAFEGFDPEKVARFTPARVEKLLENPGIIRNRLKVAGAVKNAKAFLEVQREFGTFDRYAWDFVGGSPKQNAWRSMKEVPASTPESDALSKDLKKRGFTFVGSTIMYAWMQAVGMVNDHFTGCPRHEEVRRMA